MMIGMLTWIGYGRDNCKSAFAASRLGKRMIFVRRDLTEIDVESGDKA